LIFHVWISDNFTGCLNINVRGVTEMKLIKVVLVAIMLLTSYLTLTACQVASPLEDYTWVMTSYSEGGEAVNALPGTQVTAFFNSKDKTVKGSGGCNIYSGSYEVDHLDLTIGPMAVTEMFCGEERGAQETAYLKILQSADGFKLDHGNLIIHSGKKMITFQRSNSTVKPINQWGE
jgi:heat shock protein HslJ